MWCNLLCCHLILILATAVAASREGCSPFHVVKDNGRCSSCLQSGLARPTQLSCYDRIEVRWVEAFGRVDAMRLTSESNPILKQSIDTVRYQKLAPSNATVGDKLHFTVGFLDMKKLVDKFLIWKPKQQDGSDCVFDASQYNFFGRSSRWSLLGNLGRNWIEVCQQSDMGENVIVQCNYQRLLALEMTRSDGQELTECDIPAEVEAYGTEVTPQIVFSQEFKSAV